MSDPLSSEKFAQFEHKLNDIHRALVGDPQLGHKGIVDRLANVETHVERHNRKLLVWGGTVAGGLAVLEFFKARLFGG